MVHSGGWHQLLIQMVRITTQYQDILTEESLMQLRRIQVLFQWKQSLSTSGGKYEFQTTTGVHEIMWTHDLPALRACWHTCYVSKMALSRVGKHCYTPVRFCRLVLLRQGKDHSMKWTRSWSNVWLYKWKLGIFFSYFGSYMFDFEKKRRFVTDVS